jgi:peptidoglycan/LPS O-acetylase OafA/YrhL
MNTGQQSHAKRETPCKSLTCKAFFSTMLAERTGLEPATPGVTGRTTNLVLARPAGVFDIPRIDPNAAVITWQAERVFQRIQTPTTMPPHHAAQYHFIDSLRAVAALWVLIGHCLIWGGWGGGTLLSVPKLAVDLFMMISGFLMAANAAREPLHHADNRLRFWLRRFFRLAPVYYLALALVFVSHDWYRTGYTLLQDANPRAWLGLHLDDLPQVNSFNLANAVAHVTFVFGMSPYWASSTMLPDWSLGLEMQFYLAFPALLLLLERVGFLRGAIVLAVAAALVSGWVQLNYPFREPSLLPLKLMHFLAGMLMWHALAKGAVLSGLLAVLLAASDNIYGARTMVLPIMAACMLALGIMERFGTTPPALARVIRSRAVKLGSDTSYSVYLLHGFLIAGAGHLLHTWGAGSRTLTMLAAVGVGSYLLGYAVHRWVELPGIALGRRVIDRLVPRRAEGRVAHPVQPQAQRAEHQADG